MTAACQDMESIPEKHLTVEEKTKLKERLALLKKEYKKTVHRLQRSQRAERVKTHVKKTIEEQNRLLSQELSNPHSGSVLTGPLNDASNVAGKVCASQSVISPSADKERKLSVSFNLDPEVLHDDKKSPACSGSESSGQEPSAASKTEPTQSSNPNQYKRSRLRLNRSARRVYTESMSPSTVTSLQGQHTIEAACTKGTAPNNKCLTEDEALRIHAVSENTRPVQASPDRDLSVSVLGQKNSNTEATNAPASPVFNKEDVLTTVKASSGSLEGLYPKEETLDTGQSGEVTTDRSQAAHSNASNIDHLTGDRLPPVTKLLKGTSQELSADLHPVPEVVETSPPLSENHPGAAVKYNGESSVMDAERSPLDSCTLVEGLLFPVEYYVRTTRRMTSCQRKVDLEAVIHSQLGTTRRGMRQRRASISSTPSLQVSGTPVRTPSHSATRSRRGRGRKSCPASVSSGLQNISVQLKFGSDATPITDGSQVVKETLQEKELGIQTGAENLQIKEGVKRVEAVTPKSGGRKVHRSGAEEDYIHGLHDSTNLTEKIQDIRTSRERSEPSSPFYLPSSRLHLQHLLRHLDITDFHLPDEDFGVLKLEKLKSASHLEMFIPDPTKEKKRYRRAYSTDSSTMPATDPSALLHGAVQENATISDQWNTDGMLGGDCLRLVSEIKVKDTCTGGCPVDLCSVWWEFSGCDDLCIVSATEYSVCLWRPQEVHKWKCVHTWNFSEMPVIQILPLYQEKNVVCIALGNLDIMEIWALSSHPQLHTWEKQLVKSGHTKTAQGLSRGRVVSSSGGGGTQVLELWQLSENGSVSGSHTLAAPKDSIVAFSEVDGESDALVGSTVDNNLVLWNSVTGHLLNTFQIGSLCSDITCISATSDSGLLFFVVGSLFSKPSEISGSCIFRLIVTNPQGGASAFIMAYTLPEGLGSRYLEGDVKKQRAAAVLTCGSIALWDLPRSHCSAVLPPDSDTPWCLVRWGNRPSCLLAGRKDGTICVYEYTDCG
ncbi:partner and localizer of BRCA2 isoform X4 [Dendropsophus ebraccatus]|uniref:partner and localizer of BRCA2 isoform X4 n=1 Tax=Dendropsophus ebraccatus TaxID=150705 RepID=UPI0038319577